MPNYGLKKISRYVRRNRWRLNDMPTVMSVAVVANKTTIERAGGRPAKQAIINDVKKATEYINDNKLASVVEINISCFNAGKEPFIEAESLDALLTTLKSAQYPPALCICRTVALLGSSSAPLIGGRIG